ncbi:MAG: MarC family protein [Alphaproteobacteria bacterium]|nr:MarC family protein [Alphaproteobacteria bacterium]MBU1515048.1 MarC family protein [Alphaproteobacteria bacterium]MBU2095697.1 MarC family protein [Alphaproteobacteria bacterium]MBU2152808.1 MarC family protein [Alphaproteobacteria bacterium]MBU2309943.1 MarC family protein [Alphaproteobacteria bacterium]
MSQAEFAVNFFVALFALLDPVGNVPLFAAATAGAKSRDRAWIALYISLFVLGFLTFFYFTGLSLLEFFGISLPAFRIAGGIILFLLGLEMARDDFTATYAEAAEAPVTSGRAYVRKRFERMIVPFAMPLLIGPGAISSVVIYASQARQFGMQGAFVGVGVISAVALATLLSFLATPIITKLLGRIGLTIVVRVLGLILCALAIQFILAGFAESTTGFIRPGVANPYGH